MRKRPRILGFTGNPGAGKSTITRIMERRSDIHVICVDEIAEREVLKGHLCQDIEKLLGVDIYRADENERKVLCWKKIREACFTSREVEITFRNWLADVLWPIIEQEIATVDANVVCIEHALLYEVGWDIHCSFVICVWCDYWTAVKRLVLHRNYSQGKASTRLRGQDSVEDKIRRADLSINTTNIELSQLESVVYETLSHFMK